MIISLYFLKNERFWKQTLNIWYSEVVNEIWLLLCFRQNYFCDEQSFETILLTFFVSLSRENLMFENIFGSKSRKMDEQMNLNWKLDINRALPQHSQRPSCINLENVFCLFWFLCSFVFLLMNSIEKIAVKRAQNTLRGETTNAVATATFQNKFCFGFS